MADKNTGSWLRNRWADQSEIAPEQAPCYTPQMNIDSDNLSNISSFDTEKEGDS